MADPIHAEQTRKSRFRYQFTAKHHGGGTTEDARWAADVTRADEFSVFDDADFFDFTDQAGNLFGVLRDRIGNLREIGTWAQQIAEFPFANLGVPWHGYPIWSVNDAGPANRSDQQMRPAKVVFQKLEKSGLISRRQRKRLYKGDHA